MWNRFVGRISDVGGVPIGDAIASIATGVAARIAPPTFSISRTVNGSRLESRMALRHYADNGKQMAWWMFLNWRAKKRADLQEVAGLPSFAFMPP